MHHAPASARFIYFSPLVSVGSAAPRDRVKTFASLVHEVERAIANGDPVTRVEMLRRMTRLFTDRSNALDAEQVRAFDVVILKLSQNVEVFARATLARSLAGVPQGPEHVLQDLALDPDSSVAAPVLARAT